MADQNKIAYLFAENGYELTGVEKVDLDGLMLEEAIILVLKNEHNYNPRLAEGVPLFFKKGIILEKDLLRLTSQHDAWNQIGYILDFAVNELGLIKYRDFLNKAKKNKKSEIQNMSGINGLDDFFLKYQKSEEKEWNLIGAPPYETMLKQLRVYGEAEKV